jgi:hypothetical protein
MIIGISFLCGCLDYGDAPLPYPTMLSQDGARHDLNETFVCLGAQVDSEDDGLPSLLADGDDNHNYSDEDGVSFPGPLIPGQPMYVEVTAFNPGNLSVWIDLDINGAWDVSEGMFFELNDGSNIITINVPACAQQNSYTYARFRFSSTPNLQPYGYAPDGEVEDYRVYLGEAKKCINGKVINFCKQSGLPLWEIILTNSSGEVNRTTTNDTGYYEFCSLTPGTYTITETVQPSWSASTPWMQEVFLSCNSDQTGQNFTNLRKLCLSGYMKNERDEVLSGLNIEVRNTSGLVGTAKTESSGFWQVCNLLPGNYEVREVLQSNYKPLTPASVNVTLADCVNSSSINFTNQKTYCISGQKLNNVTKQPLEGWTIYVSNSTQSWEAKTNSTGIWEVCGLGGGNYTVCEVNQPDWMQVYPEGCYEIIDLAAIIDNTGPITGLDFYNVPSDLCLSGHKFENRTGEGLGGWTIIVSNDTYDWKIITDDTGFWEKCNLTPDNYTICEVLQPAGPRSHPRAAIMQPWSTIASRTWTSTTTVRAAT